MVAAAQWGTWGPPGRERRNFGNSLVVDPWGRVVARAPDGVGVTVAELDLAEVAPGAGGPARPPAPPAEPDLLVRIAQQAVRVYVRTFRVQVLGVILCR